MPNNAGNTLAMLNVDIVCIDRWDYCPVSLSPNANSGGTLVNYFMFIDLFHFIGWMLPVGKLICRLTSHRVSDPKLNQVRPFLGLSKF